MSALSLPDTRLVREARTVIEAAGMSTPVANHSMRCYLLGSAWARARGIEVDAEDLCLAALFHDLGFVPSHRDPRRAFTLNSSAALRRFMEERGGEPARTSAIAEAIELHTSLWPRFSRGTVAGLLQIATWMDVFGLRRGRLREAARDAEATYPRGRFFPEFAAGMAMNWRPHACLGLLFPASFR